MIEKNETIDIRLPGRTNNIKDRYIDSVLANVKQEVKINKKYDPSLKRPEIPNTNTGRTYSGVEQIQNYLSSQNALNQITDIK